MNRGRAIGKSGRDGGATLVEFAFVLPLLLLLIFGIIETGRLITTYVSVSTASREGARYGTAVGIGPNGVQQYVDCVGIKDAALEKVVFGGLTDSDVTVVWDDGPPGSSIVADCDGVLGPLPSMGVIDSGDRVTVTVDTTFNAIAPILSTFYDNIGVSSTDSRTIFKGVLSG